MADTKHGTHRSGELAEAACMEVFGIEEDNDYEIKACNKSDSRVVVKVTQLERFQHKTYIIVMYRRGKRPHTKSGPRPWERTIKDAFFNHPLEFVFIPAVDLATIISTIRGRVSFVRDNRQGGYGTFKAHVNIKELMEWVGTSNVEEIETGYNQQPATIYGNGPAPLTRVTYDDVPF